MMQDTVDDVLDAGHYYCNKNAAVRKILLCRYCCSTYTVILKTLWQ